MSGFDAYRSSVHVTVSEIMGDQVTWTPAGGGDPIVVKCTVKRPTKERGYTDPVNEEIPWEFNALIPRFEYQSEDFPDLFDSVQAGTFETVEIDRIDGGGTVIEALGTWAVLEVVKMYDGHYYRARIEKQN